MLYAALQDAGQWFLPLKVPEGITARKQSARAAEQGHERFEETMNNTAMHCRRFITCCGIFVPFLILGSAGSGWAQTIPGAARPEQIEKELRPPPTPKSATEEIRLPAQAPSPPVDPNAPRFSFSRIEFQGATVFGPPQLESHFADLIGRSVPLEEVQAAATALTAHYRKDGYLLAQVVVPAQEIKDGALRIRVFEGGIADVRFQGAAGEDRRGMLKVLGEKIRASRPLRLGDLERYLLLMNDLPGVTAYGTLVPSAEPGFADLVVTVTGRRVGAELSMNNRNSKLLGTYRSDAYLESNGLLGLQERSFVRWQHAPADRLNLYSLGGELPIGTEGTKLSLAYNYIDSAVSIFDNTIPVDSRYESLNLTVSHPLIRARTHNLSPRAVFSGTNSRSDLLGTEVIDDRIRSLRLGLTYDLADAYGGINLVDILYSQGLDAFGARESGSPRLSRADGRSDYSKAELYAARLQSILPRWSLLTALTGQYSSDPLLSPEQFALGGSQFLRAFDAADLLGDSGFGAKLELRYDLPAGAFAATLYGFYEYGQVRLNKVDAQSPNNSAAASGVGARFSLPRGFQGFVEAVQPLHRNVEQEGNRHPRFFFGLKVLY